MLAGLSMPELALLMCGALLLDLLLGELPRWHPLVGFGTVAHAIERRFNRGRQLRARGLAAWLLAVLPLTLLAVLALSATGLIAHALLLYLCVGLRSLRDHNLPIEAALVAGDLAQARQLTARIVSRDTFDATPGELAKASTESLLENGNDAVFGTLFWFLVAGGAGALLFRLANTLDAMWGYRNVRFLHFGAPAARIDDALNFIPARLTALSYMLLGATMDDRRRAWSCWRQQAPAWSSPNAGPVMASGAGALGLALGGAARYDGELEQRPPLGSGRDAGAADIGRAWNLVAASAVLWLAVSAAVALAGYLIGGGHA
jgi:adenosylcobinamide-phosphate synthase